MHNTIRSLVSFPNCHQYWVNLSLNQFTAGVGGGVGEERGCKNGMVLGIFSYMSCQLVLNHFPVSV